MDIGGKRAIIGNKPGMDIGGRGKEGERVCSSNSEDKKYS